MTPTIAQRPDNFLQSFALGPFATNCYLVTDGESPECWIVDPGMGPGEVLEAVREQRFEPSTIVLTHAHLDHIAGVREVRAAYPKAKILIHRDEAEWLVDPVLNLSAGYGIPVTAPRADRLLDEGDELTLGRDVYRVLHTPGHSPGGITLVCDAIKIALVGDTLFEGSIGRSDFPGSDFDTLARSIRTKLYTLPNDFTCLPGHGEATTIGAEARTNPFVKRE